MTTDRGAVPLVNGVSRASAGKRLGHRLRISRARSLASFSQPLRIIQRSTESREVSSNTQMLVRVAAGRTNCSP
ncbi:hypothetical protein TNCV_2932691 [Trichonephila clavipes]|nr:hypothetical protein TNCV_2932691 [Trichonephila clavipes]